MNAFLARSSTGDLAIALLVAGTLAALLISIRSSGSQLLTLWARHTTALDREVRFLLYKTTGTRIALIQLGLGLALLAAAAALDELTFALVVPFVALGPTLVLRRRHVERVAKIDTQVDVWLVALGNALRAAPSLGEAITSSAQLTPAPLQEELDLALKEFSLGSPLDQALLNMAARINSRPVWGALATLLVARQTGGDVSRVLEESAASLREMARLEGVLKSKTAEGKAQAYVLAGMPFVLLIAIHAIDSHWLAPLTAGPMGFLVLGISSLLWLAGFVLARRILAVDL